MAKRKLKTPFADLLPGLSQEEFEALKADIKDHGQRDPVLTDPQGNIFDGGHRYKIVGDKVKTKVVPGSDAWSDAEKKAFALRCNLNRRQLSPAQWAALERETLRPLANELRWGPDWKTEKTKPLRTEAQVGKLLGRPKKTIHNWTSENTTLGHVAQGCTPRADVKIPKGEHETIWQRWKDGETQQAIADDYHSTQQNVAKICKTVEHKKQKQAELAKIANAPCFPDGTYDLIFADPPWQYDFSRSDSRKIENQYPTLSVEDICGLRDGEGGHVTNLAHEDCVLFLWATSPKLPEALRVIEAWGFTYKTCLVWRKDKIGMGYYARQQHELLLVAAKGKPEPPAEADRPSSVIDGPRKAHSRKPAVFYDILERMYPQAKKLELFCRIPRPGWSIWGNDPRVLKIAKKA